MSWYQDVSDVSCEKDIIVNEFLATDQMERSWTEGCSLNVWDIYRNMLYLV